MRFLWRTLASPSDQVLAGPRGGSLEGRRPGALDFRSGASLEPHGGESLRGGIRRTRALQCPAGHRDAGAHRAPPLRLPGPRPGSRVLVLSLPESGPAAPVFGREHSAVPPSCGTGGARAAGAPARFGRAVYRGDLRAACAAARDHRGHRILRCAHGEGDRSSVARRAYLARERVAARAFARSRDPTSAARLKRARDPGGTLARSGWRGPFSGPLTHRVRVRLEARSAAAGSPRGPSTTAW